MSFTSQPTAIVTNADRTQQIEKEIRTLTEKYPVIALTPVKCYVDENGDGKKQPYRTGWQSEERLSPDVVINEIKSGKANAYGLITGVRSDGILSIDVDGPDAQKILDALQADHSPLPPTLTWSSGKPGRKGMPFQVSSEHQPKLARLTRKPIKQYKDIKAGIGEDGKQQELDFRYNNFQCVLPPSAHPETGSYHWLEGLSPSEIEIAVAPDWLVDFIVGLLTPETTHKPKQWKPEYSDELLADRRSLTDSWVDAIPISQLDWIAYSHLLFALHYEGYSESDALSISQSSTKHKDRGFYDIWKYIKDDKGNNRSGGTLYYLATTEGNWKPPKRIRPACRRLLVESKYQSKDSKKQPEFDKVQSVLETISNDLSLVEKLAKLLDSELVEADLYAAVSGVYAGEDNPIELTEQWIETSFSSIAKTKLKKAIEIVGAIYAEYGDETVLPHFTKLIKQHTHLDNQNIPKGIINNVANAINPPKTDKELALEAVKKAFPDDTLKFNQLTGKVEKLGAEWKELELAYLTPELISESKLTKELSTDCLVSVAHENKFHPVVDYLDGLEKTPQLTKAEWDNLAKILLGTDDKLAQIILRKALIAAVARAYEPGCYVRMVPVLHGPQNAGKSSFLKIIGGDWFCDSLGKLDNPKDDLQLLYSSWIHEWAEIDKLNKKSAADVKAFITKTKDDYRAPYARAPQTYQRQCVIFGTVNRADFLKDATGNTRYGVISVGKVDLDKTKEWRNRIWATARAHYLAGEQWELSDLELQLSERNNESYAEIDPWLGIIEEFLSIRSQIVIDDIFKELEIDKGKRDRTQTKRISDCLTTLGWLKDKNPRHVDGHPKRVRCWRSPMHSDTDLDTDKNDICAGSVPTSVPTQNLTGKDFQGSDTDDTDKNTKKRSSEIFFSDSSTHQGTEKSGGEFIGKDMCHLCQDSETQSGQGAHTAQMSVQSSVPSVPSVPSIKTLTSEEVAAIAPGTKVWVKFLGKGINEPCYFSGWNERGTGRITGVGKDGLSQPIERSDIEAGIAQFSLIA